MEKLASLDPWAAAASKLSAHLVADAALVRVCVLQRFASSFSMKTSLNNGRNMWGNREIRTLSAAIVTSH